MPKKVYMPEDIRTGGGVAFFVSWNRLEGYLRGGDLFDSEVRQDETCEFVIQPDGIMVYVDKR